MLQSPLCPDRSSGPPLVPKHAKPSPASGPFAQVPLPTWDVCLLDIHVLGSFRPSVDALQMVSFCDNPSEVGIKSLSMMSSCCNTLHTCLTPSIFSVTCKEFVICLPMRAGAGGLLSAVSPRHKAHRGCSSQFGERNEVINGMEATVV